MQSKCILSVLVLILGVAAIIYAVHSMGRIERAKNTAHSLTSPFADNPVGKIVGDVAQGEVSQYDTKVIVLLISGIVLCLAGCGLTFYYFRKYTKRK